MRAILLCSLAAALGACTQLQAMTGIGSGGEGHVDVTVLPIALRADAPDEEVVGRLAYRGGLFLESGDRRFGGFSGLLVSDDGSRLLAVTDQAHWFTARLAYREGRLVDLTDARQAPMLGLDGRPLEDKAESDAEALTALSPAGLDGPVLVSFEREHRLWRYPLDEMGFAAIPTVQAAPEDLPNAAVNGGIEALTLLEDGQILALTEDTRDRQGDLKGWLMPSRPDATPQDAQVVFLRAQTDFLPTDAARAPDGSVLLLERSFSPRTGAGMAIRQISRSGIEPLGVLDGSQLARLDVRYSIDNMEGLAVRQSEAGETLLYVISDDNFSGLQRTVLLLFALLPDGAGAPQ